MNISLCSKEDPDLIGLVYRPSDPNAEELFFDVNLLPEFIQTPLTGYMQLTHIESDKRMLSYSTFDKSGLTSSPSECESCGIEFDYEITLGESPIKGTANVNIVSICLACVRRLQYELYLKLNELSGEISVDFL